MRTVLYTDDLEPITVLEVGRWAMEMIERHGFVRFAVSEPLRLEPPDPAAKTWPLPKQVTVFGEKFLRRGVEHWFLFTRDEENALLLKAALLPGQQRMVNDAKATAFARGFLHALARDR